MTPPLPCTGRTDLFFPTAWYGTPRYDHAVNQARIICATCPHRQACHTRATQAQEIFGVWGGTDFGAHSSERRRALRRKAG